MARRNYRALGKQVIASIDPEDCALCQRAINDGKDQLLFGTTERGKNFSVHYFCMLFSSNLIQEGEDEEGIKGFLEKSIVGEIGRGSSLLCTFCRQPGATIGCVVRKCRAVVHFPCGLENGMIFDFASPNFESYCPGDSPFAEDQVRDGVTKCSICIRNFKRLPRYAFRPITCPTCQNSFHIDCLRKTAVKSGIHHFRCPFCRDDTKFVLHCQRSGIYVPDQDAAWELDDAFSDHYEVFHACNAFQCLCPGGRMVDDAEWDITSCSTCGLNAAHGRCRNLTDDGVYICPDCTPLPPRQREGETKRSSTEWFYTRSRFHLRESKEVVQLLDTEDTEEDIDIDSDPVDVPRVPTAESNSHSTREPSLELVLEESNEKTSDGDDARQSSPSSWPDFHVRFSKDECDLMSIHLPSLPPELPSESPEKMDSEPSSSSQSRPPLSQLQKTYEDAISNEPHFTNDESPSGTVIPPPPSVRSCFSIM